MTSANAGKMGFASSGSTRPISRERWPRSRVGRSYPRTSRAVSTASLVPSDTPAFPLSTRLTVASLTPTFLATSASRRAGVGVMPQRYDICRQDIARVGSRERPRLKAARAAASSRADRVLHVANGGVSVWSVAAHPATTLGISIMSCVLAYFHRDIAPTCRSQYVEPNQRPARSRWAAAAGHLGLAALPRTRRFTPRPGAIVRGRVFRSAMVEGRCCRRAVAYPLPAAQTHLGELVAQAR